MTFRNNGDTSALPAYVPIKQAAKLSGLSISALQKLIRVGTIKAIMINGEIAVKEQDVLNGKPTLAERDAYIRNHFADLRDKPIWVAEAARRYKVSTPNICNWVKRGYIRVLGHEKNRLLLDEAEVAYCAAVYRARGGKGRWLFDKDGTAYSPKTRVTEMAPG